ncbi:MAG: transcriptional repressor [Eubacteriales bacterium]|jgi:Fe2+ or Zn2+ uptake regulation protein|nr:transcriptional repressor [Eubacteriales bacterium]
MRYSYQRQRILDYVSDSHAHPSAAAVYDALRESMPRLSLGTVYRNLNQLSDAGRIRKIILPDGTCRFDGGMHPHSHIVCSGCGAILDVIPPELPELAAAVREQTGFTLDTFETVMHGRCPACQK